VEACRIVLRATSRTPNEINYVVLVGGMTHMPKVQEVVKVIFGKEPRYTINPREVVAVGTAIHARILSGTSGTDGK
jgi:molecular chaperone DnaK